MQPKYKLKITMKMHKGPKTANFQRFKAISNSSNSVTKCFWHKTKNCPCVLRRKQALTNLYKEYRGTGI